MKNNIEIRHIQTLEDFQAIRKQWNDLHGTRPQKTAFLTWEWLYAWWKHYSAGKTLWLITAWRENSLIGVAPLMLYQSQKYGLKYRILETLGVPNTDESDFWILENEEEVVRLFFAYILSNKSQWDGINISEMNSESSITPIIINNFKKLNLITETSFGQHYHIPKNGTWEDYTSTLSKNTRESITKRLKRARKNHSLALEHIKNGDVSWEHFKLVFDINRHGKFPEKYNSAQEQAFLKEMTDGMRDKKILEMFLLYMDNKPVAFDFGFNMSGKFEDWRTGYDSNYSVHAVGKLLLYMILKKQFDGEYNDFDFLRGEYEYKTQWNPIAREFISIVAVKRFHLSAYLALIGIPKIWKWVKTNLLRKKSG